MTGEEPSERNVINKRVRAKNEASAAHIFSTLRWQLTFWFIFLTMIVYIVSSFFGGWIFHTAMSKFVNSELNALTGEIMPAIEIIGKRPSLRGWARTINNGPYRSLPVIQLYDKNAELIESYGPNGIPILFSRTRGVKKDIQEETYHIRVHSVPLHDKGELIGYLQLELYLKNVDKAVRQFNTTMTLIAPFVFICFGLAGYLFAYKAARPVEESFFVLQRFMADAGHELSTPISIILANAETLEAELPINETAKNRLDTITRSTERMSNLVGDLVLLAKMESPNILVNKDWLELDKIILSTIADFEQLFKSKGVDLKAETIDPLQVYGDGQALRRAFTNLLQNALKYTNAGGSVKVYLENLGRQAKITVADTGIGIPPESIPLIFNRFYRVESSRSREAGGFGLGLSIVKAIVDAHKGKIEIKSTAGVGTAFSILLPLK